LTISITARQNRDATDPEAKHSLILALGKHERVNVEYTGWFDCKCRYVIVDDRGFEFREGSRMAVVNFNLKSDVVLLREARDQFLKTVTKSSEPVITKDN